MRLHTVTYSCIQLYKLYTVAYSYIQLLHARMPAYLHTYLLTYLPTYPPTYLPTYIPTYLHTYIPAYLPTYPPTHLPTYLITYVHTCMHACMRANFYRYACFPAGFRNTAPKVIASSRFRSFKIFEREGSEHFALSNCLRKLARYTLRQRPGPKTDAESK